MKCKDKLKFKTAEASSKASLRTRGAIDKFLNILDVNMFNKLNKQWTKDAINRFNIEGKLFYNDNDKAVANKVAFKKIDNAKSINYQNTQSVSDQGKIASEKTIRDLAARIADRIGMTVKFESDRSKEYKGKIENNVAYVNLAYATLDTPIHEILGHPIIRAIRTNGYTTEQVPNGKWEIFKNGNEIDSSNLFNTKEEALTYIQTKSTGLYQNLLKELEYGKGKEVLDRIKRDYVEKPKLNIQNKNQYIYEDITINGIENFTFNNLTFKFNNKEYYITRNGSFMEIAPKGAITVENISEELKNKAQEVFNTAKDIIKNGVPQGNYTLEEQQEEALVELLGLMTAKKLDAVKDGKLISLLKRLLKEMKQFIRSLINQKEVEIDKLPDNMTLGDLSDLLAYSNSKLILPGYEVEYTTPDNNKFKTYQEASNHISELVKNVKDVDLDTISLSNFNMPDKFEIQEYDRIYVYEKRDGQWYEYLKGETFFKEEKVTEEYAKKGYINNINKLQEFIEKNKEYEQSKEIIEEWKKVNNIQYNPEEIYSRGQEFSSVVGAYSSFDVNLMMQNLLQHIEDNEKAGGKFAISAYTKPIDKTIGHLEGGGGKIKFKIYPKSEDILWASNTDVYSGSVWDASEKVNKDKKSELLGVSYTKYPSLQNVNAVQSNLAAIVDDLAHHHNELGISLTGSNFRLEYDEDIPYSTKKIIDSINSILDQKYGKLVKPEINVSDNIKQTKYQVRLESPDPSENLFKTFDTIEEAQKYADYMTNHLGIVEGFLKPEKVIIKKGKQPTQTRENTTSIESVKSKYNLLDTEYGTLDLNEEELISAEDYLESLQKATIILNDSSVNNEYVNANKWFINIEDNYPEGNFDTKKEAEDYLKNKIQEAQNSLNKLKSESKKEYTEQALINTKIAKLKEVAKKYPRNLIRSEVKPISQASQPLSYFEDDMPFQKLPSLEQKINKNKC